MPVPVRKFRIAFSILILSHLLAVIAPPLSFQTRGPIGQSPAVATVLAPVENYGQMLYIDRGYAFFAPDPGPSHLFQAAITAQDGQRVEQMFPDRDQQWPRLLYHRHFMLSEFLDEIYQPPGPPRELVAVDQEAAEFWIRSRARYEHVRQSVIEHLRYEHPGQDVVIRRVEHLIPDLLRYQNEAIALNDPQLYQVILDQPIPGDTNTLTAPSGPPETIPPPASAKPDDKTKETPGEQSPESVGQKKEKSSGDHESESDPAEDSEQNSTEPTEVTSPEVT